jgi:uncharacterized protein YjhX (UPF0386 family)
MIKINKEDIKDGEIFLYKFENAKTVMIATYNKLIFANLNINMWIYKNLLTNSIVNCEFGHFYRLTDEEINQFKIRNL